MAGGGGGGLFGLGGTDTKSSTNPWGPQAAQLQNIFGAAEGIYGQGPYTGRYTSEMGPIESQYMDSAMGYYAPGGAGNMAQQGQQQFANTAMGALDPAMQMYTDIYGNPITNESVAAGVNQDIIDSQAAAAQAQVEDMLVNTQNTADTAAAASGNLGSSMQAQTQAQAAGEASEDLAQMYNDIYNQQYMNTQGLMEGQQQVGLQAAGGLTGIAGMGSQANLQAQQMAETGMDRGSQIAQLERAQADREIENAIGQQYAAWDWLDRYNSVISSQNWGSDTESTSGKFDLGL